MHPNTRASTAAFVAPLPLSRSARLCASAPGKTAARYPFPRLARALRAPASSRRVNPAMSSAPASPSGDALVVMVNGLPGKMAAATAEQVVARGLTLAGEALTGPDMCAAHAVTPAVSVALQTPEQHEASVRRMREQHARLVVVDYTHPSAANRNVELYTRLGVSFVIGTTGGDAAAMETAVADAEGVYAVVAPNMAKQIVAFQAMMTMIAEQFPGVFSGYTLNVKESHQATKADTSGTAKAVVASFSDMGADTSLEIEKVRSPERSVREMKVPEEHVSSGHAFHTYTLESEDKSVNFQFQHNVCGRNVYADGTVDAVLFLDAQRRAGNSERRVFSMIDILRSGAMS